MAHQQDDDIHPDDDDAATGYKPPAQKSVAEIISTDAEDESLRKYKEALLGSALAGATEVCTLKNNNTNLFETVLKCN